MNLGIELLKCPEDNNSRQQTFNIKPVGLRDNLKIDLEMICECDCEPKQTAVR